jgi:hypothetical protein
MARPGNQETEVATVQGYLSAGEAVPYTKSPKDRGLPLTAAVLPLMGAALRLTAAARLSTGAALRPPAQAILPPTQDLLRSAQAIHLPTRTFHPLTAAVLRPPAWASWTPLTV